jgi:hypothetical protein
MLKRYGARERDIDDLAHGQVVIIVARWILVLAGLLLAMWNPASLAELRVEIFVLLGLAVANFYLHLHLLVQRRSSPQVVYAASAADLAIVTLLIAVQGGYPSNLYIFYYPAMLGLAVAFPRTLTAHYVAATLLAYGAIGGLTVETSGQLQDLVARLLMLVAVAACGAFYLGVERERRAERQDGEVSRLRDAALPVSGASGSEGPRW